jgi:alpha-mannosidase
MLRSGLRFGALTVSWAVALAALSAVLLAALPAAAQTDRPIPEWLVLGTYAVVDGEERVRHPYLPGEATVAPAAGSVTDGRPWRHALADPTRLGRLDLLPVLEGVSPVANAAAYAFTWVTSPEDRSVTLAFESDDDLRVWLNGTLVLDHEVARGVGSGTDTVTVRLAAGANRLLLKVVNRSGGFGLGGRVLADSQDPVDDLGLAAERPADVAVATAPAPAVTISPASVAAAAVLDADDGVVRVPVTLRATRWGGLTGDVSVALAGLSVPLPPAPDGRAAEVTLPSTWEELAAAARSGERITAHAGIRAYARPLSADAVLSTLGHPIEVDGWTWRDQDGTWSALPRAGPYGVDEGVRRRVGELAFRTRVPRVLAGLGLLMDAAELPDGTTFLVGGEPRTRDVRGHVTLCAPCGAGDSLNVRVRPSGPRWWDPPRLIVPDDGWFEIEEGARWARFFQGEDAATMPGADAAITLLAASVEPDKASYRAIVSEWMERLAPAAQAALGDTIALVGNSHIDAAWLWRWPETVDVVRNTWRSATKLMARYPEATYAASAAKYYEWLEAYEPELLAEVQALVREGRWEPVGGWWVEPDVNMPSGEALARQALYGQATFQRLFGAPARVAWIPDTFGYAWTLPQIFRKAGFDWFVTQKLRWNDTDAWSADRNLFWWQGRDGTRILTYIPYGYSHHLEADRLGAEWLASRDSTAGGGMLVLYGVGDHGGGPTMEMMDRRRSLERTGTYPNLLGTLPTAALTRMEADGGDAAPVIDDELYLEYHRGVYTSQAHTKRWNRRMENALTAAEVAAAHASTLPAGNAWYNYPGAALTEAWRHTLFNQFHDILPGSSIGGVYEDSEVDYRAAERLAETALERAAERIAATLDTRPPPNGPAGEAPDSELRPYVVLNPSGYDRSGEVALPWSAPGALVLDADGTALPSVVRGGQLRFLVTGVPATGANVVFVGEREGAAPVAGAEPRSSDDARVVLETETLRVELDPATGELARVFDKANARDVLLPGGGGNRLATMVDRPLQWDAWNIDDVDGPWTSVADTVRIGPVTRDALGVQVGVLRADSHGRYEQVVRLPSEGSSVEVETVASWRADHRLLKASFPLAVGADSVWAEIPYGAIGRPSLPRTRQDSARFEVPMQRWIDASAGGWGVSLVNDAKYGYDVRGDTLRLTLLKAATYPDSVADRGTHRFRYALVVHRGDWRGGATEDAAEALNRPLRALPATAHSGEGRARAFARVRGAELGALKVAEDGDGLVVRIVERHGVRAAVRLELPWNFEWRDADLLERPTGEWNEASAVAELGLAPWEIRTLRVRRR